MILTAPSKWSHILLDHNKRLWPFQVSSLNLYLWWGRRGKHHLVTCWLFHGGFERDIFILFRQTLLSIVLNPVKYPFLASPEIGLASHWAAGVRWCQHSFPASPLCTKPISIEQRAVSVSSQGQRYHNNYFQASSPSKVFLLPESLVQNWGAE